MALVELAHQLERSFATTRDLLQQLLQALQERRAAWVSVRPKVLHPSPAIEELSQRLAVEEDQRTALLATVRAQLPASATAPDSLHVNVTRIAAALPRETGRALRAAADEVTRLAKLVRTEVTLGQRLLRFAQVAQAEWAPALATTGAPRTAPGYDRRAHTLAGALTAGRLIDGRM